jgi:hypothetical protein
MPLADDAFRDASGAKRGRLVLLERIGKATDGSLHEVAVKLLPLLDLLQTGSKRNGRRSR